MSSYREDLERDFFMVLEKNVKVIELADGKSYLNYVEAVEKLTDLVAQKQKEAIVNELEKMNSHYSLKGGHLLLYEENGANVYLNDRLVTLQSTTEQEQQDDPQ